MTKDYRDALYEAIMEPNQDPPKRRGRSYSQPTPQPIVPPSPPPPSSNAARTLVIQIPSLAKIKKFIIHNRRLILKFLIVLISVGLIYGAVTIIQQLRADKNSPFTGTNIAPDKVYTPRDLPEGYSVGSASQTLENGAVLFTLYDNKGRAITVTQQSKPQEFNEKLLESAIKFPTPSGTGYVIEEEDRTTGYLFTESSWVLFNSTEGISANQMREVIYALKY